MIASLRGTLLEKDAETVIVEAGGVGYLVTVTTAVMRGLPSVGGEARLSIYTHSTQDGPFQLFGFVDGDERRVFETLLAVQGVGPRVAIAIISGLPLSELVKAIGGGDVARLTQIRGVGRKIAERLTVELREKIGIVVGPGRTVGGVPVASSAPAGRLGEVHAALIALGYRPAEIEPALPGLDAATPLPDLVKQALAALRRK